MKHAFKLKSLALSMAIAGSSVAALAPATTQAGVTGNVGIVSDYIFRGIAQNGTSAAAQGGIDYEHESGAYAGVWASNVGPGAGLEYDLYGGWAGEVSGLALGAGVTLYNYTKDSSKDSNAWDTSYTEFNLSVGYDMFTLTYDFGTHAKWANDGGDLSYSVITASVEYESVYFLYGMGDDFFAEDTDHTWFEFGYGAEIAPGTDVSFALINSSADVAQYTNGTTGNAEDTMNMVVGITKSFDIM